MSSAGEITVLLQRISSGDKGAEEELLPKVYRELKRLASACLRRERQGHTLQATALVNEAYLRLSDQKDVAWTGRTHFFAIAARIMRRILADYARQRNAGKRGGGRPHLSLDEELHVTDSQCALIEGLDEALQRLAQLDSRQAQVVEMRFFGGLTEEEIAEVLGVSSRTVKRDWMMARAWLYGELHNGP